MKFSFQDLVFSVIDGVKFFSDSCNREAFFAEFYNGANIKRFARLDSVEFRAYLTLKALEITD